jgi:hypothetical protein
MLRFRSPPTLKPPGHLDRYSHRVLYGWAWDPSNPRQRVNVDVYHRGAFIGQFSASYVRDDLRTNKIGDGRHAFRAHMPDWIGNATLGEFEAFTSYPRRAALLQPNGSPVANGRGRYEAGSFVDRIREMFAPLLRELSAQEPRTIFDAEEGAVGSSRPPLYSRLVGPSPIRPSQPLHDLRHSAYTDHIRTKHDPPDIGDTSLSRSHYDKFLKWYLENYSTARGSKRAPLSAQEISYLVEPVRTRGLSFELTRGASFFLEDHFGSLDKLGASFVDRRAIAYWWAIEESPRLFVEDCLVPSEYAEVLRSTGNLVTPYPLSEFIKIFISKNILFDGVKTSDVSQRQHYVVWIE